MRFIQPYESTRLLEALLRITDTFYSAPTKARTQKAYIKLLEDTLTEIGALAQDSLDEFYDAIEAENARKA